MISYRRDDAAAYAGRIYDRLADAFGRDSVFMDIDTIGPGEDFVAVIEKTLEAADAVLVVIGPRWQTATDASGRKRLEQADDFVRLEVQTALARERRVIPVLVGGAIMPGEAELPATLAPLARRNAVEVSDKRFHADVGELIDALTRVLEPATPAPAPPQRAATRDAVQSAAPQPVLATLRQSPWVESNLLWSAGVLTVGLYFYAALYFFVRSFRRIGASQPAGEAPGPALTWLALPALLHLYGAIAAMGTIAAFGQRIWPAEPQTGIALHISALVALGVSAVWLLAWTWLWVYRNRPPQAIDPVASDHHQTWSLRAVHQLLAFAVMYAVNGYLLILLDLRLLELLAGLGTSGGWRDLLAPSAAAIATPVCLYNAGFALLKDMVWHFLGTDVTSLSRAARQARRATHLWGFCWFWPWLYGCALSTLVTLYLVFGGSVREILH